jgi:hypothetical protein
MEVNEASLQPPFVLVHVVACNDIAATVAYVVLNSIHRL